MRWIFFLLISAAPASVWAGDWFGALVDSKCYAELDNNRNPNDTSSSVDRDRAYEIRYCTPSQKTKRFGLVQRDGENLLLDAAGNAKAIGLIRQSPPKTVEMVRVTGKEADGILNVGSITVDQGR